MKHATDGSATTRSDLAPWALLVLVVIAILVRLPGHFYPVTLHFDEAHEIWNVIRCFPPCGDPKHGFLNRHLVLLAESFYFVMGFTKGTFNSVADLHEAFATDPRGLLRAGRLVSFIAGVTTVPLTYLLGRRIWDRTVGLGGALLVAVSPQLVIVSNNLRSWSLATCLATLALLMVVRAITSTRQRDVFAAGAAAGAAMATMYVHGLLLLLPSAIALILRQRALSVRGQRPPWIADFALAAAGGAVAFLICNLSALVRWHSVLHTLFRFAARNSYGTNGNYLTNLSWYFGSLFEPYGMGPVLASLAMIGLAWTAWHTRPISWVPLSFAAAVLVIQPLVVFLWASRYTAPAYPVLLLGASALIVDACRYLANSSPWKSMAKASGALATLVLLFAAGTNLEALLRHEQALLRPPTRELARAWIERELPEKSKVVLNIKYVSPVLVDCADRAHFNQGLPDRRPCYDVVYLPLSEFTGATVEQATDTARRSLAELADDGLDYIVYTDPVPPAARVRLGQPHWQETFLDDEYELVAEFVYRDLTDIPDNTATVNPKVKIYRVGKTTSPQGHLLSPRSGS